MTLPFTFSSNRTLRKWIQVLLFLGITSRLLDSFSQEAKWFSSLVSSLVAMALVLRLSWILLMRHVLPFQFQDYVSDMLSYEYGHAIVERLDAFRRRLVQVCSSMRVTAVHVWQVVCEVIERLRGRVTGTAEESTSTNNEPEGAVEMTTSNVPSEPAVAAPTSNIMEREEDSKERSNKPIPQLLDKKQW